MIDADDLVRAGLGHEQIAVVGQRQHPGLAQAAGAVHVVRSHPSCGRSLHDAVRPVGGGEPLHQPTVVGGRERSLGRADVGGEQIALLVEGAPRIRTVVVEDPVGRRRVLTHRLSRHLVRPRHVEHLPAEGAVGTIEFLADGRLLVGLQPTGVVLARQRRVQTAHEAAAAVGHDAHLTVQVPGRQELTLDARGLREEVDLLVLVPVDEVPGLPRHPPGPRRAGRGRGARRASGQQRAAPGHHQGRPEDAATPETITTHDKTPPRLGPHPAHGAGVIVGSAAAACPDPRRRAPEGSGG